VYVVKEKKTKFELGLELKFELQDKFKLSLDVCKKFEPKGIFA